MRNLKHCLLICTMILVHSLFGQQRIGIFDQNTDIGNCKIPGSAVYSEEEQTYRINGSGTNMWFGSDEFHYLWTTLQDDFILRAEMSFVGDGVDPHRKMGWIIKNSLDSNSKHVNATVHGDGLTSLQYRMEKGSDTHEMVLPIKSVDVIQLERRDGKYIMSAAA
jgi:hypothetical protein